MRALTIAWKDVRHTYRSVAGAAMMFLAPLLLSWLLGAAFGSGESFSVQAVKTAVVDLDEGAGAGTPAAGATIVGVLTGPDLDGLLDVTRVDAVEAAKTLVDGGDADVAVIIPSGLSAALMGSTTALGDAMAPGSESGATTQVQIYKDPALNVGPSIVTAVVRSVVQSLNGTRAAAITSVRLGLSLGLVDSAALARLASTAASAYALRAQAEAPVTVDQRGPQIAAADDRSNPNVATQVLVGMMLFFMLFGASVPARSVLDEHREGTLPRLFTTPVPRGVILGGKYIAVFLTALIQAVVLVLAGWLLLGADWGKPGPVTVLVLTSALVSASLGLVTVSFAKTPAQAGAVSSAIFVFLGLVSGTFTGSIDTGGVYGAVQKISPLGWLMQAWGDVLYGGSWGAIAVPVLVVIGFTIVLFGIATFFFRRRYA